MWPLLPFAAAGLGAASKLFSGFASSNAAELAAQQDRSNAELSDTQAQTAQIGAQQSLTQGAFQAGQVARKTRSTNAAATSYFAGHNINPALGSPLALEGYSAAQGATDMALAGARGEGGYAEGLTKTANLYGQAANQQWNAVSKENEATTDRVSGIFGAATSLLSAGSAPWSSLSSMFSQNAPIAVGTYMMPRIGSGFG